MAFRVRAFLPLLLLCLVQPAAAQAPATPAAQQAGNPAPSPAPLFCTLSSAHSCTGATCTKSDTFGELKLPAKLLVHFENQMIASTSNDGFPHISHIASFAKTGNDYVLQGVDHASGWMIHLDEGGAKMSFVLTTNAVALVGTGTCKKVG
ncbi:MAG: hypothetical protein DI543_00055 [Bradyrhizobium icense]|nr:MAG: hypothetical protein DI543_00055 [Bradyrhizobium icense]